MSEFYCLELEFPDVDFSTFYVNNNIDVEKIHHAHLFPNKDEVELKIFYDAKTYFGERFAHWISSLDFEKFGSFLNVIVTKDFQNERLQKVDLSASKLIGCTNSSNFYENGKKYIVIKIDTAKFYWNPVENKTLTAEFYLDDKGFRIVEPFYSFLIQKSFFKNEGKFELGRMNGSSKFYKLGKSKFRPEYNFVSKDNRQNRVATVTKEPKIEFKYESGITEKEAIHYGDVVLMLASFYYHIKIDYLLRRIHLPENTITIKNIEQKNYIETSGNLREFGIYWNFNEFFQSSWQKETLKNYSLISKAVTLFNQSHLVDNFSAFLIRYNIIEVCDKQTENNVKFKLVKNKKQLKQKQEDALNILLETIDEKEHEEFAKRWQDVQAFLQNKPMKNQLISFLESQNLDPKTFPIKIKDLKDLRNNITHGSIEKVNIEKLIQANILLYRISGILILNLMGINNWKLNTIIKN